jgi:hypothetical protein
VQTARRQALIAGRIAIVTSTPAKIPTCLQPQLRAKQALGGYAQRRHKSRHLLCMQQGSHGGVIGLQQPSSHALRGTDSGKFGPRPPAGTNTGTFAHTASAFMFLQIITVNSAGDGFTLHEKELRYVLSKVNALTVLPR